MINPYARIRELEAINASLRDELAAARAKLSAGGRAAQAKHRAHVMSVCAEIAATNAERAGGRF